MPDVISGRSGTVIAFGRKCRGLLLQLLQLSVPTTNAAPATHNGVGAHDSQTHKCSIRKSADKHQQRGKHVRHRFRRYNRVDVAHNTDGMDVFEGRSIRTRWTRFVGMARPRGGATRLAEDDRCNGDGRSRPTTDRASPRDIDVTLT